MSATKNRWEKRKDCSQKTSRLLINGVEVATVTNVERGAWEGCTRLGATLVHCWGGTEKSVRQGCVNVLYAYALGKAQKVAAR